MRSLVLEAPALYGDHHVIEVRRILFEIPGVEEVYASSSFQTIEVQYDEGRLTPEEVKAVLEKAGYLGALPFPAETGVPAKQGGKNGTYFRHTFALAETTKVAGFNQNVTFDGRPLWPCPGLGVIEDQEEEDNG